MVALGFGIIYVGYMVGFTGYCWVRGYDVSFKEIISPLSFYTGPWPPPPITDPAVLLPGQGGGQAGKASTADAANAGMQGGVKVSQDSGNQISNLFPIVKPGG